MGHSEQLFYIQEMHRNNVKEVIPAITDSLSVNWIGLWTRSTHIHLCFRKRFLLFRRKNFTCSHKHSEASSVSHSRKFSQNLLLDHSRDFRFDQTDDQSITWPYQIINLSVKIDGQRNRYGVGVCVRYSSPA